MMNQRKRQPSVADYGLADLGFFGFAVLAMRLKAVLI